MGQTARRAAITGPAGASRRPGPATVISLSVSSRNSLSRILWQIAVMLVLVIGLMLALAHAEGVDPLELVRSSREALLQFQITAADQRLMKLEQEKLAERVAVLETL